MKKTIFTYVAVSLLATASQNAVSAVSSEQAERLGKDLTPIGAERAANTDGSIPEWTGGLPTNAGHVDAKGFLEDPFAADKPLFVITAANLEQYRDKLTPGQIAMFNRYPATFRMPIYPSRRSAALPDDIYPRIRTSALETTAEDNGYAVGNFQNSRYYAFPIPQDGLQVLWNHITRYRGGNMRRVITQATPSTNGTFIPVRFEETVAAPQDLPDLPAGKGENIISYFKQQVTAPARLAGNVLLVYETLDQLKEPRMAWLYNAGQRRVRRAPQVDYDGPGTAADGLRTTDNFDMFGGAPDRYDWKLVGKRELYIPYNSYQLDSPSLKYKDIIHAGHLNQEHARYELHRVWEVIATVKPEARHIYAQRQMYFDEDTWQLAHVDHYDGRGQLWRVAEGHMQQYYHVKTPAYTLEVIYDLNSGRYLALGMKNEERSSFEFGIPARFADFTPAALRNEGVR